MNLTPDELIMAACAVEKEAKDLGRLAALATVTPDDRGFLLGRVNQRLACMRKLLDAASGANDPRPSLTRDLLQELGLTRGVLDWHEDRTFTLTLADLERLVVAARSA